ncbi:diadenylate cyclase CdaA [Akkermansiaceae bacterium]|jgi:diadenylate cyclase|nr:TIGR00159 family protein [Verrucomicrobiota bacterium]MDA7493896.1 diadenylate cyclase CdaA [Akkermansiaceae bacterium]MDA7533968.1 diadenylate cyclase CdaA [bacterium]MBT7213893.1 TIGR00159 family protein [Verrucomicrobiota bacterium]MBT7970283.1 TIGR00159 family protein [Verrucomicrobiota bacterium]
MENWRAGVEVLVLWILIYQTYRVFRATRGARILVGLTVVIILMTLASQILDLKVIEWIIKSAAAVLAFALLIIFQPELRNGLARLGSTNLFSFSTSQQKIFLDALTEAVMKLSKKRFGALFAIERGIELSEYERTGVVIDSAISVELVATVFHPKTALHDGGMILKKERIASAACIFPVSQKQLSDRSLGLRHRAGFGITEETDAVAVIVSEETGAISIVVEEKIYRNLSEDEFREKLEEIFLIHGEVHKEMAAEELDGEDRRSDSGDRDQISD